MKKSSAAIFDSLSDGIKSLVELDWSIFMSDEAVMPVLEESIIGGFLGHAIGDALGVPAEFTPRTYLKNHPVTGMGYANELMEDRQPVGSWSDDSSLTFCLAESLCNGYNTADIADKFQRWLKQAYWTAHHVVFDVGISTSIAIDNMGKGIPLTECGLSHEGNNGNGGLMRILPLVYFLCWRNPIERLKIVHEVTELTHAHPRSLIASAIYIEFLTYVLFGIKPKVAYTRMQKSIQFIYTNAKASYRDELYHFSRILQANIYELPETGIQSSGYVLHTLEASLWAFLTHDNYRDTVLTAVNLGEDSDTTSAVAGGMAGLYYGVQAIPRDYLMLVARRDDIIDLAKRFSVYLRTMPVTPILNQESRVSSENESDHFLTSLSTPANMDCPERVRPPNNVSATAFSPVLADSLPKLCPPSCSLG